MLVRVFGEYVRARRKGMGLTQKEFGRLCRLGEYNRGLSQQDISEIELGKYLGRYHHQETLERLAIALGETAEALRKRLPEEVLKKPTTPLGMLIQEKRRKRGLSRVEGARALGISFHAFTCLELGHTFGLQFWMVKPLATFLRVEENALIQFLSSRQNTPPPEHIKELKPKRKWSSRKKVASGFMANNARKPNGVAMSSHSLRMLLIGSRATEAGVKIQQ